VFKVLFPFENGIFMTIKILQRPLQGHRWRPPRRAPMLARGP
jgi:hypothetical protein